MITSIIIPAYNGLPLTQACIESIRRHTPQDEREIIVVDNGSADGTADWLRQQEDVRLIANAENRGFPVACNQGLAAASGDYLLLLNNDTIVTPRWLAQLRACLDADPSHGAAGPVASSASYLTAIPVSYASAREMTAFAEAYNRSDPSKWQERLKLIGFCLLLKREVYETVGPLDERFTPGNFEDDDYCLRIRQAGYKVFLCKDTFIHHEGSSSFGRDVNRFRQLMERNAAMFADKWGFNPLYSLNIRTDLLSWIEEPRERPLKVLEVGCACGATLLEIRNRYPRAELYGLELNPRAASIASAFANVAVGDIESATLAYPDGYFDYVVYADVLEHLKDPWTILRRTLPLLAPAGKVLASIPNVGHYSVILDLIRGRWNYADRVLLNKTHLRFFTFESLGQLFKDSGFESMEFKEIQVAPSPDEEAWIGRLAEAFGTASQRQWMSYQYLVRAVKPDSASYRAFKNAVRRLEWGIEPEDSEREAVSLWERGSVTEAEVTLYLTRDSAKPDETNDLLEKILKPREDAHESP